MTSSAHSKFIQAGEKLYPELGYRKLSVRALAAEAGLSAGMFHYLFANKDAFILEMLEFHNQQTLSDLENMELPENPFEKLRLVTFSRARHIRKNLLIIHRLFADSADGTEVVNRFIRENTEKSMAMFTEILEACGRCDNSIPATTVQRLSYFTGAVIAPMVLGSRFKQTDLLSESLAAEVPDILSDHSIEQRIDWCINAMFPNHQESFKSN